MKQLRFFMAIAVIALIGSSQETISVTVQETKQASEKFTKMPDDIKKAIETGDKKKVKKYLSNGGDIEARDSAGYTLLMYAVAHAQLGIMKFLIENGANVNAKLPSGHLVAQVGIVNLKRNEGALTDVLQILFEGGVDLTLKNNKDRTIHQYAQDNGVGRAYTYGQIFSLMSTEGSEEKAIDAINALLNDKADINAKIASGKTLLTAAALYRKPKLIRFLIEKGAKVNALDGQGNAALHYVLSEPGKLGTQAAVKELIAHGADVNTLDNGGNTALLVLAKSASNRMTDSNTTGENSFKFVDPKEFKALVLQLLQAGVDTNKKDTMGVTAEQWLKNSFGKEYKEVLQAYEKEKEMRSALQPRLIQDVTNIAADYEFGTPSQLDDIKAAIRENKVDVLKKLIKDSSVLLTADGSGYTPLLVAIEWDNKDAAQAILAKLKEDSTLFKKALEHTNSSGLTALGLAKHKESEKITELLQPYYDNGKVKLPNQQATSSQSSSSSSSSKK